MICPDCGSTDVHVFGSYTEIWAMRQEQQCEVFECKTCLYLFDCYDDEMTRTGDTTSGFGFTRPDVSDYWED